MDRIARRRPLLLTAFALAAVSAVACGEPPLGPVGVTVGPRRPEKVPSPRAAGKSGTAAATLPSPDDYRRGFARLEGEPFRSQGHFVGRYLVQLYANEQGKRAYEALHGEAEPGAAFVAEHFDDRAPNGQPVVIFTMEKTSETDGGVAWRYGALTAAGERSEPETLGACEQCHADAPKDHVFRIP